MSHEMPHKYWYVLQYLTVLQTGGRRIRLLFRFTRSRINCFFPFFASQRTSNNFCVLERPAVPTTGVLNQISYIIDNNWLNQLLPCFPCLSPDAIWSLSTMRSFDCVMSSCITFVKSFLSCSLRYVGQSVKEKTIEGSSHWRKQEGESREWGVYTHTELHVCERKRRGDLWDLGRVLEQAASKNL